MFQQFLIIEKQHGGYMKKYFFKKIQYFNFFHFSPKY